MANPQKENGYTPVANEILEHLMKVTLSGSRFRIIMAVWRYTYGFSRKEAELSDTYLAKAIGVTRQNLNRDIQHLFNMKIITVVKRGSVDGTRSILAFNKNYNEWVVSKTITGIKNDTSIENDNSPAIENDNTPAIKNDTKPAIEIDTQEKQDIKQDIKQERRKKGADAPSPTAPNEERGSQIKQEQIKLGKYCNVVLSAEEYDQLLLEFGEDIVSHYIEIVDERANKSENSHRWKHWDNLVRRSISEKWGGDVPKQNNIKNYNEGRRFYYD